MSGRAAQEMATQKQSDAWTLFRQPPAVPAQVCVCTSLCVRVWTHISEAPLAAAILSSQCDMEPTRMVATPRGRECGVGGGQRGRVRARGKDREEGGRRSSERVEAGETVTLDLSVFSQ